MAGLWQDFSLDDSKVYRLQRISKGTDGLLCELASFNREESKVE